MACPLCSRMINEGFINNVDIVGRLHETSFLTFPAHVALIGSVACS